MKTQKDLFQEEIEIPWIFHKNAKFRKHEFPGGKANFPCPLEISPQATAEQRTALFLEKKWKNPADYFGKWQPGRVPAEALGSFQFSGHFFPFRTIFLTVIFLAYLATYLP
ncbi:MAG: hypothetical protein J6Z31_02825 [Fibrobacter sp.]|nr:hypothetical protein [Fibrobacter sp.]